MLGSDPIAALLGSGVDPRSPQVIWKQYLRRLVINGCAVTMTGPDVVVPSSADFDTATALRDLSWQYPSGCLMPSPPTVKLLAEAGNIDESVERVNARVGAYFRLLTKVLGKDRAQDLLDTGAVTAGAAIHVGRSHMVAVTIPDEEALAQWRQWAVEASGDRRERHAAPTLLIPGTCGAFLFRTPATVPLGAPPTDPKFVWFGPQSLTLGRCRIETGEVTLPIPPTRLGGQSVNRLGPCRMLPSWLEETIRSCAPASAA